MVYLQCDYAEGCIPEIMDFLVETNMVATEGYTEDEYCAKARQLIKKACDAPNADVYLTVGGTHTNKVVINSTLRPYQGVIAASTGHVNVHETGTIEAGGHKVLAIPSEDGKITAAQIKELVDAHYYANPYHAVQPGMVYISNPTETGTMYNKAELLAIRAVCDEYNLPLYLDGARMAYGLFAEGNDLTLSDYAKICDIFYIGGTKCGALMGEAILVLNDKLKKDFMYNIKQNGALLAKGRLLGIQFIPLFDERQCYFRSGEHGIKLAMKLKKALIEMNVPFKYDSPTNQQFPILPAKVADEIGKKYAYDDNGFTDADHKCVRFCTSWATKEEDIDNLIADLKAML